ncbi:MAG: hypothetical protein WCA64_08695 [Gallionella sp.]
MDVDFNKLENSGVQMPPTESCGINSVDWLDKRLVKIMYGKSGGAIPGIGEVNISAMYEIKNKSQMENKSTCAHAGIPQILHFSAGPILHVVHHTAAYAPITR